MVPRGSKSRSSSDPGSSVTISKRDQPRSIRSVDLVDILKVLVTFCPGTAATEARISRIETFRILALLQSLKTPSGKGLFRFPQFPRTLFKFSEDLRMFQSCQSAFKTFQHLRNIYRNPESLQEPFQKCSKDPRTFGRTETFSLKTENLFMNPRTK